MKTSIKKCDCSHDFQDRKYGRGNRVHNKTQKQKGQTTFYRCTVCGKEH